MRSKALVFLCVIVALTLMWPDQPVQAGSWLLYGGGKLLIPDAGTTESWGGGEMVSFGWENDAGNVIVWGTYQGYKTGEALNVDEGHGGLVYLSPEAFPSLHLGFFVNPGLGAGDTGGNTNVEFAAMLNAGIYSNFSERFRGYLGGGLSNVKETTVYGIQLGVSWALQ